jgi:hypothetical protein
VLQLFRVAVLLFPLTAALRNGRTFLTSLVEDPEPSDSVEASQGSGFFGSHQGGRHAGFQLEHASIVHPLEEGKESVADPTSFLKSNAAVEINQVRVPLLRDKDVPLVSHIQVDNSSEVNCVEDPF